MKDLVRIINEVKSVKGTKAKEQILRDNKDNKILKDFLFYVYHPQYKYGATQKQIRKYYDDLQNTFFISTSQWENFNEMFEELKNENINNELRLKVTSFIDKQEDKDFQELLLKSLDRNLDLGIGLTIIERVFENLYPKYGVQLAAKYSPGMIEEGSKFWLTEKLNGVRCTYNNGMLKTRQGKEIIGCHHILKEIADNYIDDYTIDGELIRINDDNVSDHENFRLTTGLVSKKNEDKTQLKFVIFDIILPEDFEKGISYNNYSQRRNLMNRIARNFALNKNNKYIEITPVLYEGDDQNKIYETLKKMDKLDKEGIMINLDTKYETKRNKGLLKAKSFQEADLRIVSVEEGRGQNKGKLGAIVVDYKGYLVNVGSGFTKEEREKYWLEKDNLILKIATVRFQEESRDKNGNLSLQFPVFSVIRFDKDEVSYN